MSYIEDLKTKIGQVVFQNQLKSNKRKKEICNLENAKSIGILYDATHEEQIQQIQPFVSYFFDLRKEVKALGYVNAKKLSYCHTPKLQYDFFYLKDLNWYKKPQNYIIDNFIKKERVFNDLGKIVLNPELGRKNTHDITVADLTGTGVQDTAIARYAYSIAINKNLGKKVE